MVIINMEINIAMTITMFMVNDLFLDIEGTNL